jgi:hypothetical protein
MSSTAVRALSGVIAAVAALVVWVIAVPVLDIDLTTTDWQGKPMVIGPINIIIFSIGPALAGWATIAILERLAPNKGKLIWTIVAAAFVALSLLPLSQMGAGAAITLGLMHVVVGGIVIAAMRATSQSSPAIAATTA